MKSESDEILELEEALRGDLPDERDAARIRARLAGLGLGVGVTLTSATAAALAGSKTTAPAGAWGFLSALPLGAKVGIASIATASAVAAPVFYSQSDAPAAPPSAQVVATPAARAPVAPSPHPASVPAAEATADSPVPEPEAELETEAPASRAATRERASRGASPVPARDGAAPASDAATLGEETRLIDAALSALRRSDRAAAAEFIRQHERRFPDGLLRRERERARAALNEHLENRHE